MSDSEDEEIAERQFKIVLLGHSGSGKTSIATRYCHDEFTRHYNPTSGVDFFLKKTLINGSRHVSLQIWDVGGQSINGNMLDKYLFGAHMLIFVYDITNIASLESIDLWLEVSRSISAAHHQQPTLALLGNKCDMEHQKQVKIEKLTNIIHENGFIHHIVSARTSEMIVLSFQKLIAHMLGVRLTKSEQEASLPVMKAMLVAEQKFVPKPSTDMSKSSVCSIQ